MGPTTPEPPVVIIAPPPPEAAPRDEDPRPVREETKLKAGGLEVSLGTLLFRPSLGDTIFHGEGTPLGGDQRIKFRHTGRELAVESPLMWGGEFTAFYLRRYFAIGLGGFIAGHPGGTDVDPTNRLAASQVNVGDLTTFGGLLDVATAIPFGVVTLRPGVVGGIRYFSMSMTGFEKKTCHGKHGTYPCYESADTNVLPFVEPRLRLVVVPSARSGVSFGAYVGMEAVGGTGPTAGLFVGITPTPHDGLQP